MTRILIVALIAASLGATSCARTRRVDPESESIQGVLGMDSKEVIDFTDQATRDMLANVERFQNPTGKPPVIAFFSIENNTNQPINEDIFLRRVRSSMLQKSYGKFRFLDESAMARIDEIRAQKRAGTLSHTELKQLTGADFLLTGALDSVAQSEGRRASNYVLMTMRLTDTETGEVMWDQPYEFRKDRYLSLF
jgi:PBP1b-binding outer membrane lipoprotein LpoB